VPQPDAMSVPLHAPAEAPAAPAFPTIDSVPQPGTTAPAAPVADVTELGPISPEYQNADPDIIAALQQVLFTGASDLHITANAAPMLRVDGGLSPVAGASIWTAEKVRASLLKVENVKSVVPMGISGALVTSGNTIDLALEKLRNAVKARRDAKTDAQRAQAETRVASEKGHVRQIVSVLQGDLKNAKAVQDERTIDPADVAAVNRAASDAFWQDFDKQPFESLEFLENRIASQAADADLLFLNYIGTDFQAFQKSFDRMKIVEGTMVPPGKRGFLFAKHVYEEQLKLKAARRLDQIKEGTENEGETIATDPDLKRMVRENVSQVREILLQLDAPKTVDFRAKLQRELGSQETDVGKLLAAFFQTDDRNFRGRYDFFYRELAPSLELYRVRIGDVLTIKAFTRSGYVQSVNVPVYGTFEFQGLEKSTLAGALNLMDMVSFRELYGFMSGEKLAEIQALQKAAGARDVSRENAEAELFGTKSDATLSGSPRRIEATTTPKTRIPPSVTPCCSMFAVRNASTTPMYETRTVSFWRPMKSFSNGGMTRLMAWGNTT